MKRWLIIVILIGALILMNTKQVKADPNVVNNVRQWRPLADKYGNAYAVDTNLILGFICVESAGNPNARSEDDARGLMQVLPSTLPDINQMLGTNYGPDDLYNPEVGIQCGVAYINWLHNFFNGDVDKTIRAFYEGPGNIQKNPNLGGDYLAKVVAYFNYINGELNT